MTTSRRFALISGLALWASTADGAAPCGAGVPPASPPVQAGRLHHEVPVDARTESATTADEGFVLPPGDPWAAPQQVGRTRRPGPGDALVFKDRIVPHWYHDTRFWYRNDLPGGAREFVGVDAERGTRGPAFDHGRLAAALSRAAGGEAYRPDRLPFDAIEFDDDAKAIRFRVGEATWKCPLDSYVCSRVKPDDAAPARPAQDRGVGANAGRRSRGRPDDEDRGGPGRGLVPSPDHGKIAYVKDHNVFVYSIGDFGATRLSRDGRPGLAYGRLSWSPDSKALVAFRIEPGDRKEVYLIQSSPPGGGRARLRSRPYALPGDKFTAYELNLFDVAARKSIRPAVDRIDSEYDTPRLHWDRDGRHFAYEKIDRGHQRYRLIRVDSRTGAASNLIDEKSETFIWTAHNEQLNLRTVTWLDESDELLHASERDGWRHLYLIDARTGAVKNRVTRGPYVVRGIDHVDAAKRQVWFRAGGRNADQDPYFLHHYRVDLDGTNLVALTEGNGSHLVQYSPDRRFLIDTYSRVDLAPVHELRRASDGELVCRLEEADISRLKAAGWRPPEVFVAKGRDGRTDIWGIICWPKDFDPRRKYPVIENIYAGPHGASVPKTFSAERRFASLTDLGFIVVQIDGMGTAHRSKAFHDVCWRNLKDAGFPDRILWHRAAAGKYPSYDLTRVGIYGGSAGGQNATAGVLFHPAFYRAAVSGCGCHDNRMDKASWNEQWMGYPVGPWYADSSNVDNASRLGGRLLLIVGELDTNVPPESTMRLVDALIKAGKDFELLVVPNANHGMGGAYGWRRLQDFFVRHLQGGEPGGRDRPPRRDESLARAGPAAADEKAGADRGRSRSRPEPAADSFDLADLNGDRSELRGAILRYDVDRDSLLRSAPPPVSPRRDERIRDFTAHWLDRLGAVDFDRLSPDGQVDFLLLKNHLAHELRRIEIRARARSEAEPLVPFAGPILELDAARRALRPMDWSQVAGDLTRLTREIDAARRALDRAAPAPGPDQAKDRAGARVRAANRSLAAVEGLRATLRGWFGFYDGYDPLFTWWMQEPYKATDQALQAYAGSLRQRSGTTGPVAAGELGPGPGRRRGGGGGPGGAGRDQPAGPGPGQPLRGDQEIVGNPIGREALLAELKFEMIAYSPEELIDLARRELRWCEGEMKKAARDLGRGDDWRAALEHVKTLHVEPGRQPVLIRDLALEAIAYLDAHDLVTVPPLCRDSWHMAMMSPERQLVNPFFLGGETITVSYPTSSMPHEAKMMSMRGNNIHFSRATVFHELIPGHHLQGYMTARHKTYRRLFDTPFWGEGWALYWELLLWDRGFARSPEDRIGMLFWRMHRCARIIFSLGFHLEQMTPQECIDFLVDRVGHERDNATAEVRRSFATSYGPLYQAAYLLGGLQLRALHRELVESGKMTDRAFHDAILRENSMPIEMVRALLTHQGLTPDSTPSWKFSGPDPQSTPADRKTGPAPPAGGPGDRDG
jgi:dipeptidyl aminopeptidase/acylaminoacyl peptidase